MNVIPNGMNRREFLFAGAGAGVGLPLGVIGAKLATPSPARSELLTLYPESSKYKPTPGNAFYVPVSDGHEIYVEQVGNPNGIPIVFLHGGPGYWFTEANKRFFDPDVYRIILFDQRGANRSKPLGRLEGNTADKIVSDIEIIRKHKKVNVPKWNIFGGSWGALLARKYVNAHPESVSSLILRALPPDRPEPRYDHLFGTSKRMYPDRYRNFMNPVAHLLPPGEPKHIDILRAYFRLLTSDNRQTRENAVRSYEGIFVSNVIPPKEEETVTDRDIAEEQIDSWFRIHDHFIEPGSLSNQEQVNKIPDVPICIIHGHVDLITPYRTSEELYEMLLKTPGRNKANVYLAPVDSGHASDEPFIRDRLIRATKALPEKLSNNSTWPSLMGLPI